MSLINTDNMVQARVERKEEHPFISVIIPVRNGEGRLETCLESLRKQTYPKERFEIIVADGRSTDRTEAIAKHYGAKVVDNPGIIAATGKNVAIQMAQGDLLAFTEDDCILPPDWLAIGEKFLCDNRIAGVGGATPLPDSATDFSKAVFILFRWAAAIGYSVQSDISTFSSTSDLPGGNVIYRSRVIKEVGLYSKNLPIAEDVDMNIRIKKKGYQLAYEPNFFAWHNKRDSPLRFFEQIRRFATGRVQLGRRHPGGVRPLHAITALLVPLAMIGTSIILAVGSINTVANLFLAMIITLFFAGFASSGSLMVSLLLVPVSLIFSMGWSIGFLFESFFPKQDKRVTQ